MLASIVQQSESAVCVCSIARCVQLFAVSWTVAHQTLLSMEFSRQEYWSGLSFSTPRDLPDPGIELGSHAWLADSLLSEPPVRPKNT